MIMRSYRKVPYIAGAAIYSPVPHSACGYVAPYLR